ncbi:uncharacterized protein [Gorilla gorilla gorilla]|uniref:uncharacterized protein n=1 Tax=Gorilla gorilla gorilla TaxID=9595 RepID=UPI0008F51087|nr:uncharacterized protein LOC109025615 [Gorilla gorilla gorilla]
MLCAGRRGGGEPTAWVSARAETRAQSECVRTSLAAAGTRGPGGRGLAGGKGKLKRGWEREGGSGRTGRRVHFHKKAEIAVGSRISRPCSPSPIPGFLQEAGSGAQSPKCVLWSLMMLIKCGFKCCPEEAGFLFVCGMEGPCRGTKRHPENSEDPEAPLKQIPR